MVILARPPVVPRITMMTAGARSVFLLARKQRPLPSDVAPVRTIELLLSDLITPGLRRKNTGDA